MKRKSKMISVRLSDEEYEGLRTLCANRGARSVSDLAREAMNQLLSMPETAPFDARLQDLHGRLSRLEQIVDAK